MMSDKAKDNQKPVAGIILAAGSGSRMGMTKQLLPLEQTTLLGHVIHAARHSCLDNLYVVLGFDAKKIRRTLDLSGIHVVENPDWKKGQSFSVAAGVKALWAGFSGALFLLGDQPRVTVRTIDRLVFEFQARDHWIVAPCYNGQRGNPVLVASPLFDRLKHPAGDIGARRLFHDFRHRMYCLDVDDPGILKDVDTPQDYAALVRDPTG